MSKKKQRGIVNSWLEIRDKCRFKRPLCILMFILPLISWFFYFSYPLLSFPLTHFSIEFILSLLPIIIAFLNSSCFNLSSIPFPLPLFCFPFHSAIPSSFFRVFPHRGRDGRREETNGRYPVRTGWWASWGRGRWRTRG